MGAADHLEITGAKGGDSKPKTPVEAPDSLSSTNIAKILLAVGEGEFDGTPTDRDIYLDNTPIMDASGNVNFPGVKWEWRRGTVEQDYIQGIPSVENETTVNVELRSDNPFTRALSNTQLSAVRVRMAWPRLAQQDSSGNTNGYRIDYAIDIATDGGAYAEAHLGAVDGKTTNGYQRSVRVNLPAATSGWMLRVRRLTPNANSGTIADTMSIAGYTEIIDEKLRYPNTALLYIEFDAQQFQNIPSVTVKCKAKRWPVPSNYDPATRTFTGVWDGTFKQAWTNNPAFVTYGLCVEDRFGLGKRIKSWMVDKWEMYRIAQYCDQLVPDGVGGQEPRFLCDMNLQGRAEAWTLLRDLSAIYRGMVYWAHGSLFMQADMPRAQDIDYVFTRANVIDGEFVYRGAERNTHYSRALVSYDNPANNYDTDVIPVTDLALQRRYRDRPIEISAIGCTRASEAQRRGKWALLSNSQDRTVTFKTGMEGRIPLPGFVIPVADELVAGRPNGGRISAAAGRVVTLDRDTPIKAGDRLILNLPNGTAQARTVQSVAGRAVTVTTAYGVQPEPELQWAIDYDDLAVQLFRVLKTTRTQEGDYEITALEFNPSKFAAIDTGAKLDERPISVIPVKTVQPPASVSLTSAYAVDQGIAVSTMTIAWPAAQGAVAYDVEWRKDNGNWIRLQRTGATSVDVVGIYAGAYLARVRAVSSFDITSIWKSSTLTELKGKEGAPPALAYLRTKSEIFGIRLSWGFPEGAGDTAYTELQMASEYTGQSPEELGLQAYPTSGYLHSGMAAGVVRFFRGRLVDRTGNIGPWTDWVHGQSSADANEILDYITGKITETQLGQNLLSEIEKISGTGPGSINERIEGVAEDLNERITVGDNALQGQLDTLQAQIADIAGAPDWESGKSYLAGSLVKLDGKMYRAKQDVPAGTPVTNGAYWEYIGDYASIGDMVAALAVRLDGVETSVEEINGELAAVASRVLGVEAQVNPDMAGGNDWFAGGAAVKAGTWTVYSAFANADLAIARQVDEVKVSVGNVEAAVSQESYARATEDEALAQSITKLGVKVDGNTADITQEASTRANGDEALAQTITQMGVRVGDAESKITQESVTRATADTALAQQITQMGVRVGDAESAITTESTTRATADLALTQQIVKANSRIDDAEASITTEINTRATADEAITQSITQMGSRVGNAESAISQEALTRANADTALTQQVSLANSRIGDAEASIATEATTRANADSALSQSITQVGVRVGNAEGNIQAISSAQASTDGKLNLMYSIKLGVNSNGTYYAAGMAIGIENTPSGMQSQVVFLADRFAVLQSINGVPQAMFAVENGQTVIASAFISKLAVQNAMVGNTIYSSQVTNWGPQIMSQDFTTGRIAIHHPTMANTYTEMDRNGIKVYINGVLRVRMGTW